jgi:enoyl-CoA hydratase/carnithine racemase
MIAAINGTCLAQGAGVALLCDIRVAAEHVRFGWPQVKRGIGSVSGPTILARMVPHTVAFEYLFTGEFFSAEKALELHLVNRVVPAEKVMTTVEEIAAQVLKNAPIALRAMKQATVLTETLSQQNAFEVAYGMLNIANSTRDAAEGKLAFAEKREPVWEGR